jgi:hypothetical protein
MRERRLWAVLICLLGTNPSRSKIDVIDVASYYTGQFTVRRKRR